MAARILVVPTTLLLGLVGCSPGEQCVMSADCSDGELCRAGLCVARASSDDPAAGDEGDGGDTAGDSGSDDDATCLPDDVQGPSMIIRAPAPYEPVHGVMTIRVEVSDPSGVRPNAVIARIADRHDLTLAGDGSMFSGAFDTTRLGLMQFPSIVVSAVDSCGNLGRQGSEFALDLMPPAISFAAADVQAYTEASKEGGIMCSQVFNPLGERNVKHGDVIDPGSFFGTGFVPRVHIVDVGVSLVHNAYVPVAGVDETTTHLYVLDSVGLQAGHKLVAGDNDGRCTHIDPVVQPNPIVRFPDQAIVQRLVRMPEVGSPDFSPGGPVNAPCTKTGDLDAPPEQLCDLPERITVWLEDTYVLNDYDFSCSGGVFDILNDTVDGPACLAAVAADQFGQWGISRPIAICIDRDGVGDECAGFDSSDDAAARCTDGCTLPPDVDWPARFYWDKTP